MTMTTTGPTAWLDLAGAPPIPGLRFRLWRDQSDYEPLAALLRATSTADGIPWLPTAEQLRLQYQGNPDLDPGRDIVLVELDGRVVACAASGSVVRDGAQIFEAWGRVHPAVRRRGLGTMLLAWNIARIRERAAVIQPGQPIVIQDDAEDGQVGALALLRQHEFERIRTFYLMRRDLTDPVPEAEMPAGLEFRTVTSDQHRAVYDAEVEAFRDHWGHREGSDHGFEVTFGHKEIDTDLWVVAWAGDQIAGVIENWIWAEENAALGVDRGWVETVCVLRPWRRRGLARAMTLASLARLRAAGMTEAMLGVDATNPNGAVALYEGVGFEIFRREGAYRRTFQP
jgi:mycothiol synthase